jgi:rhodanese-related sulfurtransferase
MESQAQSGRWQQARRLIGEAVLITVLSAMLGATVNLFHPERIPFVADKDYNTLVPCPVPGGPVEPCPVPASGLNPGDTLFIDARPQKEFSAGHAPGAVNLIYDFLEPVPQESLKELAALVARKKPRRIAVYGDGRDPDSGEQLGRELSGAGFKNVCFVKGGAAALVPQGKGGGHE